MNTEKCNNYYLYGFLKSDFDLMIEFLTPIFKLNGENEYFFQNIDINFHNKEEFHLLPINVIDASKIILYNNNILTNYNDNEQNSSIYSKPYFAFELDDKVYFGDYEYISEVIQKNKDRISRHKHMYYDVLLFTKEYNAAKELINSEAFFGDYLSEKQLFLCRSIKLDEINELEQRNYNLSEKNNVFAKKVELKSRCVGNFEIEKYPKLKLLELLKIRNSKFEKSLEKINKINSSILISTDEILNEFIEFINKPRELVSVSRGSTKSEIRKKNRIDNSKKTEMSIDISGVYSKEELNELKNKLIISMSSEKEKNIVGRIVSENGTSKIKFNRNIESDEYDFKIERKN